VNLELPKETAALDATERGVGTNLLLVKNTARRGWLSILANMAREVPADRYFVSLKLRHTPEKPVLPVMDTEACSAAMPFTAIVVPVLIVVWNP
jgi:hypothetical protein